MKIHSSSLSLPTSTSSRPKTKVSGVDDVSYIDKSTSEKQQSSPQPTSTNEIQKILSTVVAQLPESNTEGFDTRTSKALNAYRQQASLPISTYHMSVITGIDVYA